MNFKCPKCKEPLVLEDIKWRRYGCPNYHCHIDVSSIGAGILEYVYYVWIDDVRYKVEQQWGGKITDPITGDTGTMIFSKQTKTPKYSLNQKGKWERRGFKKHITKLLTLDRFFRPQIAEDGTIQFDAIYNKLKMYVMFS